MTADNSTSNLAKTDAESALKALISSVQAAVAGGNKVTLPGFGTFAPTDRKARTGMNPQTRAPIEIPASKSVKFAVGSEFKKRINPSFRRLLLETVRSVRWRSR